MSTSLIPLAASPGGTSHASLHGAWIVIFIVVAVLILVIGGLMALRYLRK